MWISIAPNGIYYSYALKTTDQGGFHTSYHKDGSVCRKRNGVKEKIAQHQPLKSFKGKYYLWNMVLSNVMSGQVGGAPSLQDEKIRFSDTYRCKTIQEKACRYWNQSDFV